MLNKKNYIQQGAQKRKATDTSDDAEKSEKGTTSAKIPRMLEADEMEKIIIEEERRRVERNRMYVNCHDKTNKPPNEELDNLL